MFSVVSYFFPLFHKTFNITKDLNAVAIYPVAFEILNIGLFFVKKFATLPKTFNINCYLMISSITFFELLSVQFLPPKNLSLIIPLRSIVKDVGRE